VTIIGNPVLAVVDLSGLVAVVGAVNVSNNASLWSEALPR